MQNRITGVKTIAYFFKSDFVWKRHQRLELDEGLISEIEADFPNLRVKSMEVVEYYSDNTNSVVDWYEVDLVYLR